MHRLEELVRLHRLGQTARAIARQLKMGRDTVRQYVRVLGEAGVLDGAVDELPGVDALKAIIDERLGATAPPQQRSSLEPYADEIKRRRATAPARPRSTTGCDCTARATRERSPP